MHERVIIDKQSAENEVLSAYARALLCNVGNFAFTYSLKDTDIFTLAKIQVKWLCLMTFLMQFLHRMLLNGPGTMQVKYEWLPYLLPKSKYEYST
jgi:hypothetical protein